MMNTRIPSTAHTVTRATRASRLAAASLLALAALGSAAGSSLAAGGGSGSIWTTNEPCSAPAAQNVNVYAIGEDVYVRGANFDATPAVAWTVSGQPGGASGDPGTVVASGSSSDIDAEGGFCLLVYTVLSGDWGVYSVDVAQGKTSKNDNYTVDESTDPGTTDPGTTDPGTTDPGTTDPGTTDPGTTDPGTTDPGTTDPGTTDPGTTDPGTTDPGTTPTQSVLGAVSDGSSITLPATDTVSDVVTGGSSLLLILGLAGLAGAAVLLVPTRRREADATE